ncbi:hypothetical protein PG994_009591 [Apiospora phragmitis]|uniref:Uncharacterized protein n=1 Tax=Apiospora phragmitis TaxID=2905665 RepID=A0ABR1U6L9_9PEZI
MEALQLQQDHAAQPTIRQELTDSEPRRNENCCILVTGLPSTVAVADSIRKVQIRQLGKIAAIQVHPPRPHIHTAAVKVTMWDGAGAHRIMRAVRTGNFGVDGHQLWAYWNRVKAFQQRRHNRSRVIQVKGHPDMVAPDVLLSWFACHFYFDMGQVLVKLSTPDTMIVEYRFGSYVKQAQSALTLLHNTYHKAEVDCVYTDDPCEPADNDLTLAQLMSETTLAVNP